jgi:hypothetical protein
MCPTGLQLQRFMRVELPRPEVLAVVRHLLTKCPECAKVTGPLWRAGAQPRQPRTPRYFPAKPPGEGDTGEGASENP